MLGTTSGICQQTLELLSDISASGLHEELSKHSICAGLFLRWSVTWIIYFSSMYIVELRKLRYKEGKMEVKGNDTVY
jgi:hypothetical protein